MTRLIVADDHALVRDGLKLIVAGMLPGVSFLEACDAPSLLGAARGAPDARLALVDLNMPGMDKGLRLAQLSREHPSLPLVAISALTSPDVVRATLALPSVYAFVPKSGTSDHVRLAISAALQGIRMVFAEAPGDEAPVPGLTPRMREIRNLVQQGLTNKRIAQKLDISVGTVKNHMTEIFRVLNVSNRTQAAQYDRDAA